MVLVVKEDELAQPQVASKRCGFLRHTFHQIAVTADRVSVVVDNLVPGPVETSSEPCLRDGHSNRVTESLPKRPGSNFDADRVTAFGVSGRLASPFTETLQFVERQIIAGKMQQTVEQHRAVSGRQHETV